MCCIGKFTGKACAGDATGKIKLFLLLLSTKELYFPACIKAYRNATVAWLTLYAFV